MKHIRTILATLVLIAIIASAAAFTSAENTDAEAWQADILKLMDVDRAPHSTSIHYDLSLPDGAEPERHTCSQQLVSFFILYSGNN